MDRIEINSAVCSGKPVIRGTRIMVRNILGMVAGGYSAEKVVETYPELSREDVAAAIEYAARNPTKRRKPGETAYLLRSTENARRLMRSVEEAKAGRARTAKLPK